MTLSTSNQYTPEFKKTLEFTHGIELDETPETEQNEEIEKLWQVFVSGMHCYTEANLSAN